MTTYLSKSPKCKRDSGFSLIEITFVIVIVAVIVSTIIFTTQARLDVARIFTTKERLQIIIDAIDRYIENYGHIPCPAKITEAKTGTDYGWATGSAADYGTPYPGVGGTPLGTTYPKGNCSQADTLYTGTNGDVVRGMVPVRSLVPPLDPQTAVDGWGNRFSYVIAENFSMRENYDGTGNYTSSDIKLFNHPDTGSGYSGAYVGNPVYMLISHGPNGHGSYRDKSPASAIDIGSEATNDDTENTDGDQNFSQSMPLAQYYDDILIAKTRWQLPDLLN